MEYQPVSEQKTIDEKMKRLDEILDEYETLNGLPRFQNSELSAEINKYLTMPSEAIEKLHPSDCANISVRLSQQSFHLQRAYNREKSTVTSMKIALDKCMAGHLNNYNTFIKYELNVAAVVNEDVYACKLQTVIARATQRMNRLYALAESLRDISNAYLNVQRVKLAIMKSVGN